MHYTTVNVIWFLSLLFLFFFYSFEKQAKMRYFIDVIRATIITKRVRDWKKLEMIAQEYTCPFATISNSIYAYNQIEQREFVICQTIMTHIWQQRYGRNQGSAWDGTGRKKWSHGTDEKNSSHGTGPLFKIFRPVPSHPM